MDVLNKKPDYKKRDNKAQDKKFSKKIEGTVSFNHEPRQKSKKNDYHAKKDGDKKPYEKKPYEKKDFKSQK